MERFLAGAPQPVPGQEVIHFSDLPGKVLNFAEPDVSHLSNGPINKYLAGKMSP